VQADVPSLGFLGERAASRIHSKYSDRKVHIDSRLGLVWHEVRGAVALLNLALKHNLRVFSGDERIVGVSPIAGPGETGSSRRRQVAVGDDLNPVCRQ
jgi:hypothetical protein